MALAEDTNGRFMTGDEIERERILRKWSRRVLAEVTGIKPGAIQRIERFAGPLPEESLAIAAVFEQYPVNSPPPPIASDPDHINRDKIGRKQLRRIDGDVAVVPDGTGSPRKFRLEDLPCKPRFATLRNRSRLTLGGAVGAIAAEVGTPLMPWQQYVVDVALEIDRDTGRLRYREVVLTVPRQSGKTTLLLSVMIHRALGFMQRQRIIYAAQNRIEARKKWEDDHVAQLELSSFDSLFRVRKSSGAEAIIWANGSTHGITANTEKAGHGEVLDLGVVDEAFAQVDDRLEQAFKPAMVTRPQPQMWIVSTAGTQDSVFLREKVEGGRSRCLRDPFGQDDGNKTAYFEWSADLEEDSTDEKVWARVMPALITKQNPGGTVPIDAIRADFSTMPLPEFRRAYLNQWDTRRAEPAIPMEIWNLRKNARSKAMHPVAFSFDVSPDRKWSSICAASPNKDGKWHLEVIENAEGTGWVVRRMKQLAARHKPRAIVCDSVGPAASLQTDMRDAGVEVTTTSTREHIEACGMVYDDVIEDRMVHLGQPELNAAMDGADRRRVGDAWLWDRKNSAVDISPLVGVTLARWAYANVASKKLSVW